MVLPLEAEVGGLRDRAENAPRPSLQRAGGWKTGPEPAVSPVGVGVCRRVPCVPWIGHGDTTVGGWHCPEGRAGAMAKS